MFNRGFLTTVRRNALRRGVWFSALDGLERGILTLASSVVDEIRSTDLSIMLVKIIAKLKKAAVGKFVRHIETFGRIRASQIREQAERFGYQHASDLNSDAGFIRFLAFLDFNQPIGWRGT